MRVAALRTLVVAFAAISLTCTATSAFALPLLPEDPPPATPSTSTADPTLLAATPDAPATSLDAALAEALSLEDRIERDSDDAVALQTRIEAANLALFRQQDVLARTEIELYEARNDYNSRVTELYKRGGLDPLQMLLSSRTLSEFSYRLELFWAVIRNDHERFRIAQIAADQAAYEESRLESTKAEFVMMRSLKAQKVKDMRTALARQKRVIRTLSSSQARVLARRKDERKLSFREWRKTSIPVGTPVKLVTGGVAPHAESYLVAEYQPKNYRVVSQKYRAVCSWYGDEFNGRGTASGQIFNEADLTCASKTLPFGTRLAIERAGRRVVVVVTDRGPFITGRDLDLSKRAAYALGFTGVESVTVEFVEVVR